MRIRTLFLGVFLSLSAGQALADGAILKIITPADKARLDGYDVTLKTALEEAKTGNPGDVATLDAIIAKPKLAFSDFDMTGNWQCRTIKVGGNLPLVVYGWFKCRVTDDGSGWMLEKLTGSQRTKGRFYTESDNRQTYLGSFFVAGETPKKYGSGPDSDQVGYTYRTGENEWRIELPAPRFESKLDILEFRR
jgi:hypothetical protein